ARVPDERRSTGDRTGEFRVVISEQLSPVLQPIRHHSQYQTVDLDAAAKAAFVDGIRDGRAQPLRRQREVLDESLSRNGVARGPYRPNGRRFREPDDTAQPRPSR